MTENEALMPYERKSENGFVTNKLLSRPKTQGGGIIYTAVDDPTMAIHGDRFLPTWDDTDHLHFVCDKCKSVADVLQVKFDTNYGDVKYAMFLYLGCRKCGATGQRKIYFDRRARACRLQSTYDDGKIYLYGDKEEPETTVTVSQK